jgi:hypothetical protein
MKYMKYIKIYIILIMDEYFVFQILLFFVSFILVLNAKLLNDISLFRIFLISSSNQTK